MAKTKLAVSKLLPILPSEVADHLKELGVPVDAQLLRKQIASPGMEITDGERASVGYISTREIDRDNEILDPAGADLSDYQKNPVVLWAHNYSMPPIGKAVDLQIDDYGIRAKTEYAETERATEVYDLVKGGFLNAFSVGFVPLKYDYNGSKTWKETAAAYSQKWGADVSKASVIYTKWSMLEFSVVPVPANQSALIEAVGKSLHLSEDTIKQLGIDLELEITDLPQVSAPECKSLEQVESLKSLIIPIEVDVEALVKRAIARHFGRL